MSSLRKPINITTDQRTGSAYVEYLDGCSENSVVIWGDDLVTADLDEAGRVIAIEVSCFDDETLGHAQAYAESHGLQFPDSQTLSAEQS